MAKRSKRQKLPPLQRPSGLSSPAEPQGMASQLRQSLTSSAITSLVTGLVALATFCAVWLHNADKAMQDIQVPTKQAMEDDHVEITDAEHFTDRASALVSRDEAALAAYFSAHAWNQPRYYADTARKRDALATAALNLAQADEDLGSVAAYEGQLALVPATYYTAAEGYFRAAAGVWNALTPLAESSTPKEEQRSLDGMNNRRAELGQAKSSFESANLVLLSSLKRKQVDEQRVMEKETADFDRQLLEERLATAGICVSVVGLLAILGFILWPKLKS